MAWPRFLNVTDRRTDGRLTTAIPRQKSRGIQLAHVRLEE